LILRDQTDQPSSPRNEISYDLAGSGGANLTRRGFHRVWLPCAPR